MLSRFPRYRFRVVARCWAGVTSARAELEPAQACPRWRHHRSDAHLSPDCSWSLRLPTTASRASTPCSPRPSTSPACPSRHGFVRGVWTRTPPHAMLGPPHVGVACMAGGGAEAGCTTPHACERLEASMHLPTMPAGRGRQAEGGAGWDQGPAGGPARRGRRGAWACAAACQPRGPLHVCRSGAQAACEWASACLGLQRRRPWHSQAPAEREDPTKFTGKKSKAAAKTGPGSTQWEIMRMSGIPEDEIPQVGRVERPGLRPNDAPLHAQSPRQVPTACTSSVLGQELCSGLALAFVGPSPPAPPTAPPTCSLPIPSTGCGTSRLWPCAI